MPAWALREAPPVGVGDELLLGALPERELVVVAAAVVPPTEVVKLDEPVGTAVAPGFSVEDGALPPDVVEGVASGELEEPPVVVSVEVSVEVPVEDAG